MWSQWESGGRSHWPSPLRGGHGAAYSSTWATSILLRRRRLSFSANLRREAVISSGYYPGPYGLVEG
eukprot:3300696-Pyramimonas_sp.AAC.1